MIKIKINSKSIQVEEGSTVLQAAERAGYTIPTMCYYEELEHFTSCMVCMVKDAVSGKFFASCSVRAQEGMEIITDDEEVKEARQTALELLLSEHVGDCEAPCQVACPAHMNIPLMNRLLAAGQFDESLQVVLRDIAIPAILGRICPAPCEKVCRRKDVDEPVSVCLLKRYAGDEGKWSHRSDSNRPEKAFKVAVIGAGPAGLSAAFYLRNRGYQVRIFEKNEKAGGALRTPELREKLPADILEKEIDQIKNTGIDILFGKEIDQDTFNQLRQEHHALIIASGYNSSSLFPGIETDKNGIKTDRNTYQTSLPNVFAIGGARKETKMAVQSAGQGKEVAFSVDQLLNGEELTGERRKFNSRFGRLQADEVMEYLKESHPGKREQTMGYAGLGQDQVIKEAGRCLHCDCREIDNCALRDLSDVYHARQRRFTGDDRQLVEKKDQHDLIIYEPAKCIKCGICVRISEQYREKLGFTFIGRGFDVRIDIPFGEPVSEGLVQVSEKVAGACPTGAIALKKK